MAPDARMTRLPGPLKHGPCARTTRHTLWLKHGAQIEKCTKVSAGVFDLQSWEFGVGF